MAAATATSMSCDWLLTVLMKGSRSVLRQWVPSEMTLELSKKAEYMASPNAKVARAR